MSQSTNNEKVISTFHIDLSEACKNLLDEHKVEMVKTQAAIASYHASQPSGSLLAAMSAANDSDVAEPELQELGQWVFEGQDEKWVSGATNVTGQAYLHNIHKDMMYFDHRRGSWHSSGTQYHKIKLIDGEFDPSGFAVGFVARETVNDVDYLSDTPEDHDMAVESPVFSEADIAAVFRTVTPADMHHLFIKNLADVLIQRMHSQDRFSSPDSLLLGDEIKRWDAVVNINPDADGNKVFSIAGYSTNETLSSFFKPQRRTITQAELGVFRTALEVRYG